jgi:cytochrome c-type biogenesis protein CcsB
MKNFFNLFFSTRLMSVLIILFVIAMGAATFIENDFGTQTSKSFIYNTWWFELIMLMLMLNFIGNIFRYKLYRKEKWPVFIFHTAFIIILFGAFVSRYFGFEGLMSIREGAVSSTIITDKTYLDVKVSKGTDQISLSKEVLFGFIGKKTYSIQDKVAQTPFKIKTTRFIPNVKTVFEKNDTGKEHLHIVVSGMNTREDIYVPIQESVQFGNYTFSLNRPTDGALNFDYKLNNFTFHAPSDGNVLDMKTQQPTPLIKDSIYNVELMKLYSFDNLHFIITEPLLKGEQKLMAAHQSDRDKYPLDALFLEVESGEEIQPVLLYGSKNSISNPVIIKMNDLNFNLSYGSKEIKTPFSIQLNDFQMERYPGTNSASSYASEVTVLDSTFSMNYRIFMNHVLDYKGYRFFQSSYDMDEKGTVLSVNHDYWGTLITYVGYFFMGLGMFFTLFWNGSRFKDLSEKLKSLKKHQISIILLFLSYSLTTHAQNFNTDSIQISEEPNHTSLMTDDHNHVAGEMMDMKDHPKKMNNVVSKVHADKFGRLLIQDFQGRIKPLNTYALEALRKVYKKDTYQGLTAEQVLLSAQLDPYYWEEQPLIHVKAHALGKFMSTELGVEDGYTSIANFFNNVKENYYIGSKVQEVQMKKSIDRTATDKEIINLDERFNVLVSIVSGNVMQIYPKIGDSNHKWVVGFDKELIESNDTLVAKMHQTYMRSLVKAIETGDYTEADQNLDIISAYQKKYGAEIIPNTTKTNLEIAYNHWSIFKKLMMYFMLVGFVFLVFAFVDLFTKPTKWIRYTIMILTILTAIGMFLHAFGLGLRWYISGHAPWSDGYEAIVFVAFVSVLVGLYFSHKQSKFILAATVIFASLLLGIAHGSSMNPEITNLVPVLKSYWLMIHVAVITSSYAFLGLGALLGFVVLWLYILKNNKNALKLNNTIDELTYINEMVLIVGLFTLSIGTFLGGVWANESWGRYWSWDPKEVWSLISMMIYIFILHMRLVPGLRGKFAFNLASLWAISTLIMTFFGVNFYLSGMHSYAAGDPVPVPNWVYYTTVFFILFSIFSYLKYRKFSSKKS